MHYVPDCLNMILLNSQVIWTISLFIYLFIFSYVSIFFYVTIFAFHIIIYWLLSFLAIFHFRNSASLYSHSSRIEQKEFIGPARPVQWLRRRPRTALFGRRWSGRWLVGECWLDQWGWLLKDWVWGNCRGRGDVGWVGGLFSARLVLERIVDETYEAVL